MSKREATITLKTLAKTVVVLLGYMAAWWIADQVVGIHVAKTAADSKGADGMYAFADSILFLGVFGLIALVPTGAALYFLWQGKSPWTGVSNIALAIALTAPVAALVMIVTLWSDSTTVFVPPDFLTSFAILRLMVSPLLLLVFLGCSAFVPASPPRKKFFMASGLEAVSFILVVSCLLLVRH
ncbi:MAG: hypothetical protein ABI905_09975 [Betaproteobacteria bacterium]